MGLQSIVDKSEFNKFLQCGALLQLSPNQFRLIWGPFKPTPFDLVASLDEKTIIYCPQFWDFLYPTKSINSAYRGIKEVDLSNEQLLQVLNADENLQKNLNSEVEWQPPDELEFYNQFKWSQEKFRSNQLRKSVPIMLQKGQWTYSTLKLANALSLLIQGQHFGYTFGFWQGREGFLGHSPELIADWKSQDLVLNTVALAGTTTAGYYGKQQIMQDSKILQEHQIVIEDLKSILTGIDSNKKLTISETKVLELKYLNHLQTSISVKNVEPNQVLNYIEKIHPTAALGLYPRDNNMYQELSEFEIQKQRQNFAAPFCFASKDAVKAIACIRQFKFSENEIYLYSGCGVTAASILLSELSELEAKRNSVKKMMGLNS